MAGRPLKVMEVLSNSPPKKLVYKGRTYVLAKTREDLMWEQVERLLSQMLNTVKSDRPSISKKSGVAGTYQELKVFLKDLGVTL